MLSISPSQVAKWRQCRRAYAYEYNEGLWAPSSERQQFGTAMHKQLERWLRDAIVPDNSPEGEVAKQGIARGWLPQPDSRLLVEHRFGFAFDSVVQLGGIIDCVVPGEVPLVIDHKSTSDLRWAKTREQLAVDPQALIYGMWAALEYNVHEVRCRWVYYAASTGEPRKPKGTLPVEVLLSFREGPTMGAIERLVEDIESIAKVRTSATKGLDLPPSPESCGLYGGCPHQGRCMLTDAQRLASYMERGTVT